LNCLSVREFVALGEPVSSDRCNLRSSDLSLDGFNTSVGEGEFLSARGSSQNEGVVDGVNVGIEKLSRECISSCEDNEIGSHDISLESAGNESVDVFPAGDNNLTTHVTAFLSAWSLIFNVDTSGTSFNEELNELEGRGDTTETSISISNHGRKIVESRGRSSLSRGQLSSDFILSSVLEKLSSEELVNFVRNSVSWVISEIWTRFVGSRSGSRALPSRDVHSLQIF